MSDSKFVLPCVVDTNLDDNNNIWLSDKTEIKACFFDKETAEFAAEAINKLKENQRKIFSLNAIKSGLAKEQIESDKRADKQVKSMLSALTGITQGFDSEEICHHFGVDAVTAKNVISAIESANAFIGGGEV